MVCCERPLVTSCWCCGLRGGSVAAAIYALIYSAFSVAFQSWTISNNHQTGEGDKEIVSNNEVIFITTCVDIGLYVFLFMGSILVMVGATNLNRYLLVMFLIVMGLLVILQGIGSVLYIAILLRHPNAYVVVLMMIAVLFTCIDLMCELCVFSFYQELRQESRSQIGARYHSGVPLQIPVSEKNTEISFTSFTGAENCYPPQQPASHVSFLTAEAAVTATTNPINNDGVDPPPPYVA